MTAKAPILAETYCLTLQLIPLQEDSLNEADGVKDMACGANRRSHERYEGANPE
ncbi:hypothetical protein D3C71_2113720 [compost metagenome]